MITYFYSSLLNILSSVFAESLKDVFNRSKDPRKRCDFFSYSQIESLDIEDENVRIYFSDRL